MSLSKKVFKGLADNALSITALLFVGFVILRPDGFAQQEWERMRLSREYRDTVEGLWSELTRRGDAEVPVGNVIIEFVDYECPVCQRQHQEIGRFLENNKDIEIVYRQFPLSIHPHAYRAAMSVVCAEEQGLFKRMHSELYENRSWILNGDIRGVAKDVGADLHVFDTCMSSDQAKSRVEQDIQLAYALRVDGTPSFVSQDRPHYGFMHAAQLEDYVD